MSQPEVFLLRDELEAIIKAQTRTIATLTAERDALQKQLDTLSHNYRVSFEREQQLTEELNDLTMAIVHLFSPATARRIYNLRALGERS